MILELRNIFKTYLQGRMDVPVLKNVSLSVEEGEYVAIMGPSGSGKTTLMNIIGCLDNPTSGEYLLEGEDLSQQSDTKLSEVRLRSIGFVFQSFYLLSRQSAVENVALPLLYAGVKKAERMETARKALERVGLGDRTEFKPTQLSGGQCQRVAIARAIVNNPKILLADEPTGALDTASGEQVMEIFQKLNDEGVTIVMITHEREIANHARRILYIRDGRLTDEQGNFLSPDTVEQEPGLQEEALPEDLVPGDELLAEILPEKEEAAAGPDEQATLPQEGPIEKQPVQEQSAEEKPAVENPNAIDALIESVLAEADSAPSPTPDLAVEKPAEAPAEEAVVDTEPSPAEEPAQEEALAPEHPLEEAQAEPVEESAGPEFVPEVAPVEEAPVVAEPLEPRREVIPVEVDLAAVLAQEMSIEDIPVELPSAEEPEMPAEESAEPEPVPEAEPVEESAGPEPVPEEAPVEEAPVVAEPLEPRREVIPVEVDLAAVLAQEMSIEDIPVELPSAEEPEMPAEESAEPELIPEEEPVEENTQETSPDEGAAPELVARPTKAGAPDQISFDIWQEPEEVPFDTAFDAVDPYEPTPEPAPEPGAFDAPLKLDVDLSQIMEPETQEPQAAQQQPEGDFHKPIKVELDGLDLDSEPHTEQ